MKEAVYHAMAEVESKHWWFAARRRIVGHYLDLLKLPASAQVLEVGCGTGGNLELLSRYGTVQAVETDPIALEYARDRGIARVEEGRLPDGLEFDESGFDLIVLLDVLEHVEQDVASLARLRELLGPRGHLIVTVPAFGFLWSGHDTLHEHKRRYSRGELVDRMHGADLRVQRVSCFNSLLFPLIATARIAQRFSGREPIDDLSIPTAPLNRFLEEVMAVDRLAVPRLSLPIGVSLFAHGSRDA
jgi:SAM-dependent methyltransferase